jgi:5-methylcytosine-specific restriction endonuclease McrA
MKKNGSLMRTSEKPKVVEVYAPDGRRLAPCTKERAWQMIRRSKAIRIGENAVQLVVDNEMLKQFKKQVLERDNYICYITEEKLSPEEATIDHIKSRIRGGSDFPENLACCSKKHNQAKGKMDLEQYIWKLIHDEETEEKLRERLKQRFPHLVDLPEMP